MPANISTTDESVLGDFNAIYAALKNNQTCQIYDQCAARGIDCGGGLCLNTTTADDAAKCYCNSPLILVGISDNQFDCVCPSTSDFFDGVNCQSRPNPGQGKDYSRQFNRSTTPFLQVYRVIPNSRSDSIVTIRMRPSKRYVTLLNRWYGFKLSSFFF